MLFGLFKDEVTKLIGKALEFSNFRINLESPIISTTDSASHYIKIGISDGRSQF